MSIGCLQQKWRTISLGINWWNNKLKINDPTGEHQNTQAVPKRSVISIGSGAKYTLYDPGSDHIEFREALHEASTLGLGFS